MVLVFTFSLGVHTCFPSVFSLVQLGLKYFGGEGRGQYILKNGCTY